MIWYDLLIVFSSLFLQISLKKFVTILVLLFCSKLLRNLRISKTGDLYSLSHLAPNSIYFFLFLSVISSSLCPLWQQFLFKPFRCWHFNAEPYSFIKLNQIIRTTPTRIFCFSQKKNPSAFFFFYYAWQSTLRFQSL